MKQGGLLQDIAAVLDSVCGPWLNLFRRFIPPMGGVDFSPVVAIIALQLVQRLVLQLLIGVYSYRTVSVTYVGRPAPWR